ncbi:MAG: DUF488 domain-containing protein [Candidatus Sumerlaeia bacterium]|nr:DUF488 domain-containing protein [Candidatus Sumerlaeia bacterium]
MIFNRQKVVLALLQEAGRAVGRLELMKWAFLLRHDSPSFGGSAFYGFVPYKYGPFSFCLQREMGDLTERALTVETDGNHWAIGPAAPDRMIDALDFEVVRDVQHIVAAFGDCPDADGVLDHVYSRFPAYTVRSEIRRLATLPVAPPAIYTAGYQSLSADDFLDLLVQSGMRRLIDVRNNPIARRYGFHKSSLSRLCGHLSIEYFHFPELGIDSSLRRNLDSQEDRDSLFDLYERTTLAEHQDSIDRVARLLEEAPGVLVCMETEPCECHRTRLAQALTKRTGLPVIHLRG